MMKRLIYLFAAALVTIGCTHYTFKDEFNTDLIHIVMTNRSPYELKVNFMYCDWIDKYDTVYLKPHNGLWQIENDRESEDEIRRMEHTVIRMELVGKDTMWFDSGYNSLGRFNPCSRNYGEGFINLTGNSGKYYVYSFSEDAYQTLCDSLEKHKTFDMNDLCPSMVNCETGVIEGNSEAVFLRIYPTPSTRERLKLGALVSKEAGSIDRIRFFEDLTFEADSIAIKDTCYKLTWEEGSRGSYYDIDMLRKASLAHFGADFAALSGRPPGTEMKKASSIIFSHVMTTRTEAFSDKVPSDEILAAMEKTIEGSAVVRSIIYGKVMYLVAEGNCSPSRLFDQMQIRFGNYISDKNQIINNIDYHLFTLNENGEFQCQSGGEELIDVFYITKI